LGAVQQELTQLQQKSSEQQRIFDAERAAWLQDKKTLEGAIFELTTSEKSSESERASRDDEVRRLEERALSAEDRYGREVMAHAEAIKTVEGLRQQLSQAQTAARDNLAAAETVQAKLSSSKGSWDQQKEALEKEISDLNARYVEYQSTDSLF
jgi:nucleoprotein TPR